MEALVMTLGMNRHMDEEEIERYSMGAMSDEESARFDEHLLVCEDCQERVAENDEFITAMQTAGSQVRSGTPAWHLGAFSFARLIPVLAAASLVALLAFGGSRLMRSGNAEPAFAVKLAATRGAAMDAPAPAGRPLLLDLDLTGLPTQGSYRIEVVDRVGQTVWQGTAATEESQAAALVPQMQAGDYFVRAYAASGALVREFGLEVSAANRTKP